MGADIVGGVGVAILIGAPIAAATSFTLPIVLSALMALSALPVACSMHEPRHSADGGANGTSRRVRNGDPRRVARAGAALHHALQRHPRWACLRRLIFVQTFLDDHGVETGNLGLWQAPVRGAGVLAALLVPPVGARASGSAERSSRCRSRWRSRCSRWRASTNCGCSRCSWCVGMVAGSMNSDPGDVHEQAHPERAAGDDALGAERGREPASSPAVEPSSGLLADVVGLQGVFLRSG